MFNIVFVYVFFWSFLCIFHLILMIFMNDYIPKHCERYNNASKT